MSVIVNTSTPKCTLHHLVGMLKDCKILSKMFTITRPSSCTRAWALPGTTKNGKGILSDESDEYISLQLKDVGIMYAEHKFLIYKAKGSLK